MSSRRKPSASHTGAGGCRGCRAARGGSTWGTRPGGLTGRDPRRSRRHASSPLRHNNNDVVLVISESDSDGQLASLLAHEAWNREFTRDLAVLRLWHLPGPAVGIRVEMAVPWYHCMMEGQAQGAETGGWGGGAPVSSPLKDLAPTQVSRPLPHLHNTGCKGVSPSLLPKRNLA